MNPGDKITVGLAANHVLTVTVPSGATGTLTRLADSAGGAAFSPVALDGADVSVGPFPSPRRYAIVCTIGSITYASAPVDLTDLDIDGGTIGITEAFSDESGSSHQTIWADLDLSAAAGSSDGTDSAFLAPIMGNILGDALTGEGNYLGGVIGAYSITGAGASDYPRAAVMGIIMDGSTDADAAVLAVIDGSDPSSQTRARAAFGVAVNSNEADSGVDYGVDLFAAENPHYTDSPGDGRQGLNVAKAQIRTSDEVCFITGAGVPVDYTDGTPPATGETYAEIGSLYADTTNGKLYINGGTKAQPVWKLITSAT